MKKWSEIGSDSHKLVDTQTLVAHLEFYNFPMFFIVFAGRNTQQRTNDSFSVSLDILNSIIFGLYWYLNVLFVIWVEHTLQVLK